MKQYSVIITGEVAVRIDAENDLDLLNKLEKKIKDKYFDKVIAIKVFFSGV